MKRFVINEGAEELRRRYRDSMSHDPLTTRGTEVSEMMENAKFLAGATSIVLGILIGAWVFVSWQEASAFERITGKHVSTWDAMWVELRVQEAAR